MSQTPSPFYLLSEYFIDLIHDTVSVCSPILSLVPPKNLSEESVPLYLRLGLLLFSRYISVRTRVHFQTFNLPRLEQTP